jgi:hypothetical protein
MSQQAVCQTAKSGDFERISGMGGKGLPLGGKLPPPAEKLRLPPFLWAEKEFSAWMPQVSSMTR